MTERANEATGNGQEKKPPARAPTAFWDPIQYEDKEPTEKCLSTVVRQIADLEENRPRGVFVEPEDDDVTKIHALILGPAGTPYEGGFFHFVLKCPSDYPSRPPLVRLMTTDSGRVRFHPSLYENGKVCLALLGTDTVGPAWTRYHSIGSVLTIIRSLLDKENPIAEGSAFGVLPAVGTWLNSGICYNTVLQHETVRVAVCDAVEDCLKGTSPCPDTLRNEVLKQFRKLYGQYEKVVKERLPLTGSFMNDAFDGGVAMYQYETLLARLQELHERVGTGN
ncbi:ubiquitin-conjugating enzyme E2 Z [Rhipicephalus sanguineus]|uniref:Ubiquitin-conjugating enzyme E2 Z n=1 Tax=Rhipicephalus sanguineus TaxID=34632 RepID=A0A9D4SXP2_RHISA|nr:ubiquitin-conjugating enzyme E2 Z [Rhipicephalus sanguineus]KAH7957441.1 hypothetical protein HPB52_019018 [Rhipicephalus sanguineus]